MQFITSVYVFLLAMINYCSNLWYGLRSFVFVHRNLQNNLLAFQLSNAILNLPISLVLHMIPHPPLTQWQPAPQVQHHCWKCVLQMSVWLLYYYCYYYDNVNTLCQFLVFDDGFQSFSGRASNNWDGCRADTSGRHFMDTRWRQVRAWVFCAARHSATGATYQPTDEPSQTNQQIHHSQGEGHQGGSAPPGTLSAPLANQISDPEDWEPQGLS